VDTGFSSGHAPKYEILITSITSGRRRPEVM
jgi:hypothetical protein